MIEVRVDGRKVDRPTPQQVRRRRGGGLMWVDAVTCDEAEIGWLTEAFDIHPLAVEDMTQRNERPKVDDYGHHLFVVLIAALRADEAERSTIRLVETHLLVGGDYVVSVSDEALPAVRALAEETERRPELAKGEPGMLFYRICDAALNSFFPVIDDLDEAIDRLETSIIERADRATVHAIFGLKRDLNRLRRVLAPARDLFQGLAGPHGPRIGEGAQLYLRDVYDGAVRMVEQIDAYRDIVTGALDVYLTAVSNRLGEQTRRLSVVATIFLPLTFLTGFFGMNFGFLIDKISTEQAFLIAMSTMALSLPTIWLLVRRLSRRVSPIPEVAQARRWTMPKPYTYRRVRHRIAPGSGAGKEVGRAASQS